MIYLIGSRALEVLGKTYRPPSDWDLMMTPEEFETVKVAWSAYPNYKVKESSFEGKFYVDFEAGDTRTGLTKRVNIEVDATDNLSRKYITEQTPYTAFAAQSTWVFGVRTYVPVIETLWVFKKSHSDFPLFIDKTKRDLQWLAHQIVKEEGKTPYDYLSKEDKVLLKYLTAEAKERYDAKQARIKARHGKTTTLPINGFSERIN